MLSSEKDGIRKYWNSRAQDYSSNTGHGFNSAEEYGLWSQAVTRNLPAVSGKKALDLGTGPGYMAMLLCRLGYEVTGLDMSEDMLKIARQRADKLGMSLEFKQGDVESPPFEKESMDIIVCRHIMWTLFDLNKAIETWKKILRNNGILLIIDGVWTQNNIEGIIRTIAGNVIRTIRERKLPSNWKKRYINDKKLLPYINGASSKVVVDALKQADFSDIRQDNLEDVLTFERNHGSLDHRIQFAHGPRYLITASKSKSEMQ
jgi:ubiquinone/menaquinone biosynthesis C-methylase UbiE